MLSSTNEKTRVLTMRPKTSCSSNSDLNREYALGAMSLISSALQMRQNQDKHIQAAEAKMGWSTSNDEAKGEVEHSSYFFESISFDYMNQQQDIDVNNNTGPVRFRIKRKT